jgi:hypothetical protein
MLNRIHIEDIGDEQGIDVSSQDSSPIQLKGEQLEARLLPASMVEYALLLFAVLIVAARTLWRPAPQRPWPEGLVKKQTKNVVRIELTEDQKQKVREQLGEDRDAVELRVEPELEERTTPSAIGTFF